MGDRSKCPFVNAEHQRIGSTHRTLVSTGCTREFCQSGRVVHTDEPRIGENRALDVVCREATNFLQDLHSEGFFKNESDFQDRLQSIQSEIFSNSIEGVERETKTVVTLGGNWEQSFEELEIGVRRAWRNSRKCIARNHCQELKLCDLRSITTSVGMAQELVRNATEAFNGGRIEPTVFVFPPRTNNSKGPMIWNHQLLDFAGYQLEDGTILGDPSNVELTKAIIDIGWTPPCPKRRSRWDLLPLVTMAEGDEPAMIDIPAPLSTLIPIRHPRYSAFEHMKLKWKTTPVLTRLGFDIGGVQYTAAPFMGWFMDAEIGVRNLADSFRYNVLPDVVQALYLNQENMYGHAEAFEDLAEYEQLALMSKAQAELNYAVQWSYNQIGVAMTDSLTASKKWCRFDDEFKAKHGYRLPADPYWIAPPQGSIIPLWHRGGAPNYQPKPMISKHVQDPVKAWKRQNKQKEMTLIPTTVLIPLQNASISPAVVLKKEPEVTVQEIEESWEDEVEAAQTSCKLINKKTMAIYFCSNGTVAERLARKAYQRMAALQDSLNIALSPRIDCLNKLTSEDITPNTIILVVASSTGKGEVPSNGAVFLHLKASTSMVNTRFSVFGNGDSRYSGSFNGAATQIHRHMQSLGGWPLIGKVFRGDTAVESIPYSALNAWCDGLQSKLTFANDAPQVNNGKEEIFGASEESLERFADHSKDLQSFKGGFIVAAKSAASDDPRRSLYLSVDVGTSTFEDMSCIQILPLNCPTKVNRALQLFNAGGATSVKLISDDLTFAEFLTEFVDLELPFTDLSWLAQIDTPASLAQGLLRHLSALDTLELLHKAKLLTKFCETESRLREILISMPLLHTRTYSIASSLDYQWTTKASSNLKTNNIIVDIMIKKISNGRFSDIFLSDSTELATIKYRIVDSVAGATLRCRERSQKPLIAVATGAGFGPVRCLLERRIAAALELWDKSHPRVSIFLGLHPSDVQLAKPILEEASRLGLIDMLYIVESNEQKLRVYDKLSEEEIVQKVRDKLIQQQASVFVCAGEAAAKSTKGVFEGILGSEASKIMSDRYIEEVF